MAIEVVMPALEMAQDTGTLVRWLKAEGDFVQKGEPLMEIETDKVTVEIESPASGILSNLAAQPGDEVPVGQVIALLIAEGETQPEGQDPLHTPDDPLVREHKPVGATPLARRLAAGHGLDLGRMPVPMGTDRIREEDVLAHLQAQQSPAGNWEVSPQLKPASPKARRLAAQHGMDLAHYIGPRPDGAMLAADVQAVLAKQANWALAVRHAPTKTNEYTAIPVQGKRKVIAERLQASYQTAPHIALTLSADMTEALRIFERLRPTVQTETGHTLTTTAILAKTIGASLREHPRLNAHLVEGEIHQFSIVHLGIAVALDDGLIVPVIRNIAQKGLLSIQSELRDLTARARLGELKPFEVKGSTFTLSNLGMFGVEQFTAILNPPEVGILSVGIIQETPVGINRQIVLRPMMQMTLNVDHRAVDGTVAAEFLKALKEALENPYQLLAGDAIADLEVAM